MVLLREHGNMKNVAAEEFSLLNAILLIARYPNEKNASSLKIKMPSKHSLGTCRDKL